MRQRQQKPRGEEVAGAGGVDHVRHRVGGYGDDLAIVNRHGALCSHGDGGELAILGDALDGGVEVVGLVESLRLLDIGEDVVDGLAPHQIEEFVAEAVDAERVGQRERGGALVLVGEMRRGDEGLLGLGRVPEIAFHVGDRGAADFFLADVSGGELVAGTEIGVHRPLAAGRDEDHRARGRRAVMQTAHAVMDAELVQVAGEDVAERIGCHLADEAGAAAKARDAGRGVGSAAARDLALVVGHAVVEVGRTLRIDQMHDALVHALALQELRIDRGDHIDDRIADGEHVELCVSHRPPAVVGRGGDSGASSRPARQIDPVDRFEPRRP